MNFTESAKRKFEAIGARVKIFEDADSESYFSIDVRSDKKGEYFYLYVPTRMVDAHVIQTRRPDKHLLLFVKNGLTEEARADRDNWAKLLCGHDERHWFVAGVDLAATGVEKAKALLKPEAVLGSEARHRITASQRRRRKHAAWIRQGEWFFVLAPEIDPETDSIVQNEPIMRPSSRAHWVDQIYRCGGTKVYVCRYRPNGLTEEEYQELLSRRPKAKSWPWQVMVRDAEVYARGWVRAPDHKTIWLQGWHRVYLNNEVIGGGNVFLD